MSDPKAQHGEKKPQLQLIPPAANEAMARALELGARKYGTRNWLLGDGVNYTVYLAAILRHVDCLKDGADVDEESGTHHLGHIMAGCAILLDAQRHGTLIDDRVLPLKAHKESAPTQMSAPDASQLSGNRRPHTLV